MSMSDIKDKVFYELSKKWLENYYLDIEDALHHFYTHSKKMTYSIDKIIDMPSEITYDDIPVLNNSLATIEEALMEIGEDMRIVTNNLHNFLDTLAKAEKVSIHPDQISEE